MVWSINFLGSLSFLHFPFYKQHVTFLLLLPWSISLSPSQTSFSNNTPITGPYDRVVALYSSTLRNENSWTPLALNELDICYSLSWGQKRLGMTPWDLEKGKRSRKWQIRASAMLLQRKMLIPENCRWNNWFIHYFAIIQKIIDIPVSTHFCLKTILFEMRWT